MATVEKKSNRAYIVFDVSFDGNVPCVDDISVLYPIEVKDLKDWQYYIEVDLPDSKTEPKCLGKVAIK